MDVPAPAVLPDSFDGFEIFVRVAPEQESTLASVVQSVRERGGRPGVILRIVVSDAPIDALAFDIKTRLTSLRGRLRGGVPIGLQAPSAVLEQLLARDAGSYADFVASDQRPAGAAPWWELRDILTEASATHPPSHGAERSLWTAPQDPLVFAQALAALTRALGEEVNVRGSRPLRVDEIIARHQAAAARQADAIKTRISTGTMTLAFEAPAFPAPITITSRTRVYSDGTATDLEQRDLRVNGLEVGHGTPRLPLLEPERVVSPPLVIELTDRYRYQLDGTEIVSGTTCYVVSFAPLGGGETSFVGRAWIGGEDFALVRIAAAQTGLRGPIVSSEQIDDFARDASGLWLLRQSRVNQVYEGAAHRTPIERVLTLDAHDINPPDFEARRRAAYASPHIMLRDTPLGFRYLARSRRATEQRSDAAEREVAAAAERVRTIVAGAIVDPNISHPLPFAGISYLDFDLFGTGTQFNGFYGGTFGQLAFSMPSLAGTRWQLAGRAFGIATAFNDRAFINGAERYEENIQQRPVHGSVWLMRPLTPRVSIRAGYELDFVHYSAAGTTSSEFVVPGAQVVHALRLGVELHRRGWNASAWWSPAVRTGWREWGRGGAHFESRHRDFQRYGLSLARSVVLTPTLVGRFEGSWMGSRDLDRFSRYAFGAFDNRLRGYPAALIRYDRGGVVRGALAWSAARRLRIDGFVDSAFVQDPGFGAGFHQFTGLGAALETPAPFGTLVAGEWGYGIQGRTVAGTRGTHVFRVTAYKVF